MNFINEFIRPFFILLFLLMTSCTHQYKSTKNLSVIGVSVNRDINFLSKYSGYKFHVCANNFQKSDPEFSSYSSGVANILFKNYNMNYTNSIDNANLLVILNYTFFENVVDKMKNIDRYFMKISILDKKTKEVIFFGEAESSYSSCCSDVFHCLYSSILMSGSSIQQKSFVSCLVN